MREPVATEARAALDRSSGYRRLGRVIAGVVVVALTVAFIAANRGELPNAARAAGHADPWWLGLGVIASATFMVLHASARRVAIATFGVRLTPSRAMLTSAVAQSLNVVAKSGGMAGLAVYRDESRRSGQPTPLVTGGYVLCVVLGDAAFAVTLVGAIAVLVIDGQFTRGDAVAVAVVGAYFAIVATVVVAAARSRSAIRSLHALPARLRRRTPDHTAADELFDAIQQIRTRPASVIPVFCLMLLIELVSISMVWICLAAYGQSVGMTVPIVGYGVSVLFSLISVLPAGIGFAEASLGAVLVSFGLAGSVATVIVLTYRILETWLPLLTGVLVARTWRRRADGATP
ncbi:MAG: lysylphosphatidylglycerol synthase transmembrane domain-containing protein [Acidimicrobiales bacterium]